VSNSRIVVVGSLMLDLVVRVPRPPRIGESLFGHEFAMFVGGKGGNQALAAARLGAGGATIIGRVGNDAFGERIVEELGDGGVDCSLVQRDPRNGTGVAIPMVFDDGTNSIISVPRANLAMTAENIESARSVIEEAKLLLVQCEVSMEATFAAMKIARAAGVQVILNAAPVAALPEGMLGYADYLVVNEIEADALCPGSVDRSAQGQALRQSVPVVIITLGDQGAVVANRESIEAVPAFAVDAVDSVGAGDAFCGGLAVALCDGADLYEAVRFASASGAVSVTRRGAAASLPTRTEVERLRATSG
jgi:ribokinase